MRTRNFLKAMNGGNLSAPVVHAKSVVSEPRALKFNQRHVNYPDRITSVHTPWGVAEGYPVLDDVPTILGE